LTEASVFVFVFFFVKRRQQRTILAQLTTKKKLIIIFNSFPALKLFQFLSLPPLRRACVGFDVAAVVDASAAADVVGDAGSC
jgi:hypothetical protein